MRGPPLDMPMFHHIRLFVCWTLGVGTQVNVLIISLTNMNDIIHSDTLKTAFRSTHIFFIDTSLMGIYMFYLKKNQFKAISRWIAHSALLPFNGWPSVPVRAMCIRWQWHKTHASEISILFKFVAKIKTWLGKYKSIWKLWLRSRVTWFRKIILTCQKHRQLPVFKRKHFKLRDVRVTHIFETRIHLEKNARQRT